jgi:hypothetical protein
MRKIDRLGWAAGFTFTSYGLRVGIRVTDPTVLDRVLPLLPPGWKPSPARTVDLLYSLVVGGTRWGSRRRNFHLLYENITQVERTLDLDSALAMLEGMIRNGIAAAAPRRVFIHAGVVGWRGRAIVLPGRSMAGKSTLVDALVRSGATYLSDEFAVFDRQGRVHPFPDPLKLRPSPDDPTARPIRYLPGRTVRSRPLPLGLVVATAYRPDIKHWRPRPLSEGRTLLALIDNSPAIRLRPDFVVGTLSRAVAGVRAVHGARGEADAAAAKILELADRLNPSRGAA